MICTFGTRDVSGDQGEKSLGEPYRFISVVVRLAKKISLGYEMLRQIDSHQHKRPPLPHEIPPHSRRWDSLRQHPPSTRLIRLRDHFSNDEMTTVRHGDQAEVAFRRIGVDVVLLGVGFDKQWMAPSWLSSTGKVRVKGWLE